jgi:CDP-glucose 4,6-dehydratase
MHYLVTGHTGFKGSWLTVMLRQAGHTVSGLALDPLEGSLFESARLHELLEHDHRVDIRDADATAAAIAQTSPDVVVHMAAQPLVRESYRQPRLTYDTNVTGTMNVLEAVERTPSVKAHLVITTDKVYRNDGRVEGYREDDPLGAADPYSTSKAMADLLTQSHIASGSTVPTAIARGGNVIGGGDVSPERLIPDLVSAFGVGRAARIRNPDAVRPWQHVLDCLDGYLTIVDAMLASRAPGAWNIGPGRESFVTVGDVATLAAHLWGDSATWVAEPDTGLYESQLLSLDPSRAERELNWRNTLVYPLSVEWTIGWHRDRHDGADARALMLAQLTDYLSRSEASP